jgi:tetratricopeptide (TPR) repeat protein
MKTSRLTKVLLGLGLILLVPFMGVSQTKKEAVDAYNAGATIMKQDPKAALESFYKALEISEQLGEEGEETKTLAQTLIPRTHYELAMKLYKEKNMTGTLEQLEKAEDMAEKFNDEATKGKVAKTIPQLYNVMGTSNYKDGKYEDAIAYYNKALSFKPDYPDPLLGIALSYEKLEQVDKMFEYLDKTIEVGTKLNDQKKVEDATTKAKAFLLKKGDEAQKANKHEEALGYFNKVLNYESKDASIYFVIAINSNKVEKWDEAIEAAKKAIELTAGAEADKAAMYYELAQAYQKKKDVANACAAYRNAAFGQYKASADYQITQLKCQ